jgi:hypothetical protein
MSEKTQRVWNDIDFHHINNITADSTLRSQVYNVKIYNPELLKQKNKCINAGNCCVILQYFN